MSFSSSSSVRAASAEYSLCLKITHNLVHGSPSELVRHVKARFPKELDVLWLSDIALSLSGSLDANQVPVVDVARSGLAHHLYMLLKTNAGRLGLNNVSRPFVDDTDGLLTLTPSRPLPQPLRPHAQLVSLHLTYIWRSVAERGDLDSSRHFVEEARPFSPTLFLPIEALLNRVTEQFLIYHLVSRYPLVFGPWCRRLDLEVQYFPSIASSILEIIARSQNRGFVSKCKRLLKTARSQHKFVLQASSAALFSFANDAFESQKEENDDPFMTPTLTDEQVICESLEQLFRERIPQRRFKPVATPKFAFSSQEDDLLQAVPDEKVEDEASWVELPESVVSPCASPGDCYQTLPEDIDVFAKEGWPADDMWRGYEACTSPVDAMLAPPEFVMWEAQSDESLINGPVSLASITTRSPQACSFTLYHHQSVDHHELDPAASGLRNHGAQMALLEESESSVPFTTLTHSPQWNPHDQCFSGEYEQLMQGFRDVSEEFEVVDSWKSGSLLFEDETGDGFDVILDWL